MCSEYELKSYKKKIWIKFLVYFAKADEKN